METQQQRHDAALEKMEKTIASIEASDLKNSEKLVSCIQDARNSINAMKERGTAIHLQIDEINFRIEMIKSQRFDAAFCDGLRTLGDAFEEYGKSINQIQVGVQQNPSNIVTPNFQQQAVTTSVLQGAKAA